MQPSSQPSHSRRYFIIIGVLAVIFIALIAFGTAFFLSSFKHSAPQAKQSSVAPDAAKIVTIYTKVFAENKVFTNQYLERDKQLLTTPPPVYVVNNEKGYSLNVPASAYVLYVAKSNSQSDDISEVMQQTSATLVKNGFHQVATPIVSSTVDTKYESFTDGNISCQLTSSVPLPSVHSLEFHQLACTDMPTIATSYATSQRLLALYSKTNSALQFSQITESSNGKGDVSYIILNLTGKGSIHSLLFAAVKQQWTYIGDLSSGDSATSKGKYTIAPDIQQAIANPIYNGFLKQSIH
jgi:hypothetical protein